MTTFAVLHSAMQGAKLLLIFVNENVVTPRFLTLNVKEWRRKNWHASCIYWGVGILVLRTDRVFMARSSGVFRERAIILTAISILCAAELLTPCRCPA